MIWFGYVLWHINLCMLSNAKSASYIYIKYMISKHILFITFLNEPELFFYTVKWFQIFLFTIKHLSVHSKVVTSIAIQH